MSRKKRADFRTTSPARKRRGTCVRPAPSLALRAGAQVLLPMCLTNGNAFARIHRISMYRIPLVVAVMDTELLKGTLSLLILSLLSRKAMYGYEIAATVHRDTDGAFTWREGSLYP